MQGSSLWWQRTACQCADLHQESIRTTQGVTEQCSAGHGDHVQPSPAGGDAKQEAALIDPMTCKTHLVQLRRARTCTKLPCANTCCAVLCRRPASSAPLHTEASRLACSPHGIIMQQSPCCLAYMMVSRHKKQPEPNCAGLTIIDDHAPLAVACILPVNVHPLGLNVMSRNLPLVMPARDAGKGQSAG